MFGGIDADPEMSPSNGANRWWVAAVTAVVVLIVGAGSFLLIGQLGSSDNSELGDVDVPIETGSIEGRWVLESWEDGDDRIAVEIGLNTDDEVWLEFTADFEGERDTFISADGTGTAGRFEGSTGCNKIRPISYEYSAGFLNHGQVVIQARQCDLNAAEQALLSTLRNTPDGIEVILGTNRMEWFGSNLEGKSYPLTFRRDGSPPPPPTTEEPLPTTTLAPEEGLAMRVWDVDGVEVVAPGFTSELPEQASRVEFHTMVIDEGDGPVLCAGIVMDSLPPQCSGPVAEGLDMDGWSEETSGVRWGQRSVLVTWPPLDGFVAVLDQYEYAPPDLGYPPEALPRECEGIELEAGAGPVNDYARSLGSGNGGLYVTGDGTLVLQVVGDPEPHREALAELGGACVIEVARPQSELLAIQEAIQPQLADLPELLGTYSSSPGSGGRLDLYLPVVDRATAQAIAALVDDPTAIRIIGMAVIHG
ncbi:MAG: hypothetical protein QNJ75_07635 [Acidimicrobiia bacterium]|nr:hypothetical protein [Acidimicrobiia bacterium]MDJ0664416.1 hypothetical protein [Acidimicrobiia bacterium]